jgi:23S rRNA (pseudouridine1915-N3)-methyltransferase
MKIHIISVGQKLPDWINYGVHSYINRTPWDVSLIEIPGGKRPANYFPLDAIKQEEQAIEKYLAKISNPKFIISLAINGTMLTTSALATKLKVWSHHNKHICFIIGGPDGLGQKILTHCDFKWSLSALTFPHLIARLVVAEQMYRAWAILQNHPYHK